MKEEIKKNSSKYKCVLTSNDFANSILEHNNDMDFNIMLFIFKQIQDEYKELVENEDDCFGNKSDFEEWCKSISERTYDFEFTEMRIKYENTDRRLIKNKIKTNDNLTKYERERQEIREFIKNMRTMGFFIWGEKRDEAYNIFTKIIYERETDLISVKLNIDILPHLFNLKDTGYTIIDLLQAHRLSEKYAGKLHMMLSQLKYLNYPIQLTREELRQKMGVEKNRLLQSGHFNNRLKKIIEIIRKETDLDVKYELGTKVKKYKFWLKKPLSKKEQLLSILLEKKGKTSVEIETILEELTNK